MRNLARRAGRAQLRHPCRARPDRPRRRGDAAADAAQTGDHRHRRDRRPSITLAPLRDELVRARHRAPGDRAAARRGDQGSRAFRPAGRRRAGLRHRARHDAGRARRRRGRRHHRLRRGDLAARHRFRADPDDPVGAGRQLGRRQDRDQHAGRQKPARRLLPAAAGAGRYRHAGDAAAPRGARRLRRDRQIRPDPRRRVFRLAGSRGPGGVRPRTGGAGRARSWSAAA